MPPGGQVTVTLTNGPGGAKDWLGFTAVGSPDGSGKYLQWVYVGAGVTTRTWTVTAPTTPGQYEFRFFPNDGYTRHRHESGGHRAPRRRRRRRGRPRRSR